MDNLHDSNLFRKLLLYILYPYFVFVKNKAKKKYPDIFEIVNKGMAEQFSLEKDDALLDIFEKLDYKIIKNDDEILLKKEFRSLI